MYLYQEKRTRLPEIRFRFRHPELLAQAPVIEMVEVIATKLPH